MDALTIRRAVPSDAETLYAIHRESATTAYVHIFPPDRYRFPDAEMRAHWVASLSDDETDVVIAERDGHPVGFAGVSPGWLKNLFVVPDEWGRGAGSALHDEAVALLRAKGEGARPRAVLTMLVRSPAVGQRDSVGGERHIPTVALLQR